MKLSYNLNEAVAATGLSEKTIKRAINAGKLPAVKSSRNDDGDPTGRLLIRAKDLEAWIDGMEAA